MLVIDDDFKVYILGVKGNQVRIGIDASDNHLNHDRQHGCLDGKDKL